MNDTLIQTVAVPIRTPTGDDLTNVLIAHGTDPRAIDRARRVAAENNQRIDQVMLQLGLVSERQLAEVGAELLRTTVVTPDRY